MNEEEIKEFWDRYDVEVQVYQGHYVTSYTVLFDGGKPEAKVVYTLNLVETIDLNTLFKYAVPNVIQKVGKARGAFILQHWAHEVAMHEEDPALALFKALQQVFNEQEKQD